MGKPPNANHGCEELVMINSDGLEIVRWTVRMLAKEYAGRRMIVEHIAHHYFIVRGVGNIPTWHSM